MMSESKNASVAAFLGEQQKHPTITTTDE